MRVGYSPQYIYYELLVKLKSNDYHKKAPNIIHKNLTIHLAIPQLIRLFLVMHEFLSNNNGDINKIREWKEISLVCNH